MTASVNMQQYLDYSNADGFGETLKVVKTIKIEMKTMTLLNRSLQFFSLLALPFLSQFS